MSLHRKVKIGVVLPNGAMTLQFTDELILAQHPYQGEYQFVTWRWDGQDARSTCHGHYFGKLSDAALDYEKRLVGIASPA